MLKRFLPLTLIFALMGLMTSCDEVDLDSLLKDGELSEEDMANGLKEALKVGTDTSVATLSAVDGYYGNEALKIFLPEEADIIVDNIGVVPGGQKLLDDLILQINRSAEDAATEAKPIFVDAVTSMTITDAKDILFGEDTAATHYLKSKTYSDLKTAFQPKIKASLSKELVGGVSASSTWSTLTSKYNSVVDNPLVGGTLGLTPVNTELDEHVTEKALFGLFVKVSEEEKNIREDPLARVNDLLEKVFGELDN